MVQREAVAQALLPVQLNAWQGLSCVGNRTCKAECTWMQRTGGTARATGGCPCGACYDEGQRG